MSNIFMAVFLMTGCGTEYPATTSAYGVDELYVLGEISIKPDTSEGYFGAELLSIDTLTVTSSFLGSESGPTLLFGASDAILLDAAGSVPLLIDTPSTDSGSPNYGQRFTLDESSQLDLIFNRRSHALSTVSMSIDRTKRIIVSADRRIVEWKDSEQIGFELTLLNSVEDAPDAENISAGITIEEIRCYREQESVFDTVFNIEESYMHGYSGRRLERVVFNAGSGVYTTDSDSLLSHAQELRGDGRDPFTFCDVDIAGTVRNSLLLNGISSYSRLPVDGSITWSLTNYIMSPTITIRVNL